MYKNVLLFVICKLVWYENDDNLTKIEDEIIAPQQWVMCAYYEYLHIFVVWYFECMKTTYVVIGYHDLM